MLERTLLMLEFILFEHVAMPYVSRFHSKATANIEEEQSMTSFSEKSMKVHREVLCVLEMFSNTCKNVCNRTSSSTSIRTDCLCFSRLKHAALPITVESDSEHFLSGASQAAKAFGQCVPISHQITRCCLACTFENC